MRDRNERKPMSANDFRDLLKRDGDTCQLCGKRFTDAELASKFRPSMASVVEGDHKIPFSLGGSNDWFNMQLVHQRCNSKKGNGR